MEVKKWKVEKEREGWDFFSVLEGGKRKLRKEEIFEIKESELELKKNDEGETKNKSERAKLME